MLLGFSRIVKPSIVTGRNAELAAEILGESFRALEPGRRARRPETRNALVGQIVDDPGDQRRLGPDDHEVDRLLRQAAAIATLSSGSAERFARPRRIPGCPGRRTGCRSGELAKARAKACSRAPDPSIRTFLLSSRIAHTVARHDLSLPILADPIKGAARSCGKTWRKGNRAIATSDDAPFARAR